MVGAGCLGSVLVRALSDVGARVDGPLRRDDPVTPDAELVVLAVPDAQIACAAQRVPPGPLLAHCSGAPSLDALGPRPRLSLHPLMTIAPGADPRILRDATAAVDGSDAQALAVARALAAALVPLVREAVDAWATTGAPRALTGPVARGDEATVARQRLAVAQRTPELLTLFDALTAATRTLAGGAARTPGTEAVSC